MFVFSSTSGEFATIFVMHQLVQDFITGIAVVGVNNDVCVGFLIVYPGAEVHEFIALFLECGQVKDEM